MELKMMNTPKYQQFLLREDINEGRGQIKIKNGNKSKKTTLNNSLGFKGINSMIANSLPTNKSSRFNFTKSGQVSKKQPSMTPQ